MITTNTSLNSTEENKKTILVVDDAKENLFILTNILKNDGYDVRPAINGLSALEFVKMELPDVILLDIKMPDISGFEVCERLKTENRTREIPIIFISGLNDIDSKLKGFEMGGVDFITKPFEFEEVLTRVRTQVKNQNYKKQLEQQNKQLLELNQIQEEILCFMQHDLKVPLSPLTNIPKIIKNSGPLTTFQLEQLDKMETASRQVIKMINRTTDLVQMERGTYHFNSKPLDIIAALSKILENLDEEIKSRRIPVDIQFNNKPVKPGDSFWVPGEDLLYSMLDILIGNAVETSLTGQSVSIIINDKKHCQIKIRNEAPIPDEIQDYFLKGYPNFHKARGTGIGIYFAKLAAVLMGGSLKMETSQAIGTSLIVDLPKLPS